MSEQFRAVIEQMTGKLIEHPASSWKVDYRYQNGTLKEINIKLNIVKGEEELDEGQQDLPLNDVSVHE
jgi:hypothetical protein